MLKDRRWLRITLRGIFLAVTIVSLWLAIAVNAIHERKVLANAARAKGGIVITLADDRLDWGGRTPLDGMKQFELPFIRRILGDEPYVGIALPDAAFNKKEQKRYLSAFPEATVRRFSAPGTVFAVDDGDDSE